MIGLCGCGCEHLVVGVGDPAKIVSTDHVVERSRDAGLGVIDR